MSFYTCSLCKYTSPSKYNYNRHIILKHSENPPKYKCEYCDCTYTSEYFLKKHKQRYCSKIPLPQNVAQVPQNVAQVPQNVAQIPQNVAQIPQNVAQVPQNVAQSVTSSVNAVCIRCLKEFSRMDNLKRHYLTCTGTANPLQCHKCLQFFPSRYSKCRHLQTCTATNNQPLTTIPQINNQQIATTINNNTQNNIQNNTQNNTQNNYIITFTNDRNSRIRFNTDHITPDMIETLIQRATTDDEYAMNKDIHTGFLDYLLSAIKNRCVKKTNCRANYSHVHVGNNKWEQRHDSEIYDKFLTEITEVFIELLNKNKLSINVSKHFIKKLDEFLTYMADNGYCNEDKVTTHTVLKSYREMIQRLKNKIVEVSKSTE